ncbi:MAG TPA: hypothetical protein VMV77_14205 [Bacteroidales bacterium]|nr:hypothetical protein [Bacteroidales bacterium]
MGLPDQIESDLDTFINNDDFAIEITYTPSGGDPVVISGIYDNETEGFNIQTNQLEAGGPKILVKDSDITGVAIGDTVIKDSITYYIRGIAPDGSGMTVLTLSED